MRAGPPPVLLVVACVALVSVVLPVAGTRGRRQRRRHPRRALVQRCGARSSSASAPRTPDELRVEVEVRTPRRRAAMERRAGPRATDRAPDDETAGPELTVVLAQDDDPRLAGPRHGHRPGDRPARRDLSCLRDDPRELSTPSARRRARRRLQGSAPLWGDRAAGFGYAEPCLGGRLRRGRVPCGSRPAVASTPTARPSAGGSKRASPRRTRPRG